MHNAPDPSQFDAVWHDHGREPKCPADPKHPNGIDLDVAHNAVDSCTLALTSPTLRCGVWDIFCNKCGYRAVVTTAGRRDDPRSIRLPCRRS